MRSRGRSACRACRVGLHAVLVEGRPLSPPDRVPDLVDASGAFRDRLVSAGFIGSHTVDRLVEAG